MEIDTFRNLAELLTELKDKFAEIVRGYETILITKEGGYDLNLIERTKEIEK